MTKGYASADELNADLQLASDYLLTQVLKRNLGLPGYDSVGYGQQSPFANSNSNSGNSNGSGNNNGVNAPQQEAVGDSSSSRTTDYGTNNQEAGVEEGDLVASTANVTLAAFGDYIVAYDPISGEQVAQFRMPFNNSYFDGWYGGPEPAVDGIAVGDMRMMMRMPSIRSLVIHEATKRLLVICDGLAPLRIAEMTNAKDGSTTSSSSSSSQIVPILFQPNGTHVRLYNIDSILAGTTDPLATYDINGDFNAVRMINGIAHVMTSTGVDTYTDLVMPFERSNAAYANMSDDEYAAAVQTKAATAVPAFTNKLMSEITLSNGVVPTLARMSVFADASSVVGSVDLAMPAGPMNTYAQITSFDMTGNAITAAASGTFSSDYWARFYASTDTVLIATQGTKTIENITRQDGKQRITSIDQTFFTAFSIDGATTAPHSVGKVDGYLLNEYAMDVLDNQLRVAVTIWNSTYVWDPNWEMDDKIVVIPVDRHLRGLQNSNASTGGDSGVSDGGDNGTPADGGDVSVSPEPTDDGDDWVSTTDRTQNFVTVLQMPGPSSNEPGEMQVVGSVKIGKPDETITAVRFFDNIGYAVTFEQTDPFYVIDLSGPTILGEVEISGFSNYLHSINADNTLILAIGQEADINGTVLGMQLTIFDMSTPSSPSVVQRHSIETAADVYSYTDAQWDFKAARYSDGLLILPMDVYSMYGNDTSTEFHGFVTFTADANGIAEDCRINNNFGSGADSCYCYGGLPRRSMIFNGNVVTTQSSSIVSTNLDTCQKNWELAIDVGGQGDANQCCGVW